VRISIIGIAALALLLGARPAVADRGLALRAGFGLGNDFSIGPRTTHLEGIELGADVRIAKLDRVGELSLSPSIMLGGSTRSGADADGNVFRILATLRHSLSENAYVGVGLGWSTVDPRDGQFSSDSGIASALLFGYNFGSSSSRSARPFLEVACHAGSSNKLSGWSFTGGVRF
jgi:hypothetical protein